jgi:hypothetical protein
MKQVLCIFAALVIILPSCTTVKFKNAQPNHALALNEFPKDLLGIYFNNEKDTLTISNNSFEYGNATTSLVHVKGSLSTGEAVLKMVDSFYILSMKDENIWQVIAFKKKGDEIEIYNINIEDANQAVMKKIKAILPVKEVKDKEGSVDYYLIDPSKNEFETLIIKKIFSKRGAFKKILK